MPEVRVGISGWTYAPWRGNFYPARLPAKLELAYVTRRFNAIEVNGTFYSLQTPSTFSTWYQQSPLDFRFALKGGRFITHIRRLRDVAVPLANFFASGVLALREKIGPILWQFPPQFLFDETRFRRFFEALPQDTPAARKLARRHAAWMKGRVHLDIDHDRPLRHAVEFRHASFLTERFIALLRKFNIALVVADVASRFPTAEDATADFVYARLHGSRKMYASGYTPREIEFWARRAETWRKGREPSDARRISRPAPAARSRDVYVFFDNTDVKLRAPVDARRMAERLGVAPIAGSRAILKELGVSPRPRKGRVATSRPR